MFLMRIVDHIIFLKISTCDGSRRPCLCPHPAPCPDSSPSVVRTGQNLALPVVRDLSFCPSQAQGRVQRAPANTTPQPLVRPCVPQARALGHQDDAWAARTVPDCQRGCSWVLPPGLLHEPCSQKNPMTACLPKPNVTFLMTPQRGCSPGDFRHRRKGSSFSQTCCSNAQAQGPY